MDYAKACGLLQPVESSQLAAMGYCPEERRLVIRFHPRRSDPEGTLGPVYHYPHTPEEWAAFQAAESKGSHFIRLKKTMTDDGSGLKWPHEKIEEEKAAV